MIYDLDGATAVAILMVILIIIAICFALWDEE